MAALRSVFVAGSLLTVAAVMAPACGGRDALLFDDLGGDTGPSGQGGAVGQGGSADGGMGGSPFIVGGFGGVPNNMVTSSANTGVSTGVTTGVSSVATVGVTTSVSSVGVTTGVTSSASSGVTSSVATSGVTTVTTGVTSSVSSGNSTSAVTTSGMSSVVATSGMGGFGGSPAGGGGFTPIDCLSCVNANCPQAQACLTNPNCLTGVVCTIGTCLQGGNPPNFGCVLGCFNGDFMAAFQALNAITCIGTQCGQECQGAFGP